MDSVKRQAWNKIESMVWGAIQYVPGSISSQIWIPVVARTVRQERIMIAADIREGRQRG